MTICYFGIYKPEYSRNRILIKGLRENGVKVIECRTDLKGIGKYFNLTGKHWRIRKDYDAMVVGFPGWQAMILARFLTPKKIIFDIFFSFYDAMAFDRQAVGPGSFKAKYFWFLDWLSARLADKVLLDTDSQIDFFHKKFKINKNKFKRIFIGASTDIFYPRKINKDNKIFRVVFFGSFIPGHGIGYIIDSAKFLENENIEFRIMGRGSGQKEAIERAENLKLKNINFLGFVPQDEFNMEIAMADVCLGSFGDIGRAKRVIHNKIFECAAMGKAIITADTTGVREFFDDNDLKLVGITDSKSLADAILELKEDSAARKQLAENCYKKITEKGTPKILGARLIEMIKSMNL